MTIGTDDLGRITQQTKVVSSDGDKLGSINQVYTSDTTGDPAWVTVKTGLFGTQESFVPLSDASFDGDDIRVGVTKEAVHDAPRVDSDGHLTPEEEDELFRHYGLHNPDPGVAGDDRGGDRDDRIGDDRRDDGLGDDRLGEGVGDDRDDRLGDGGAGDRRDDGTAHDAALVGAGAAAGAGLGAAATHDRSDRDDDRDDRDGRLGDDSDDRLGRDRDGGPGGERDDSVAPRHAAPGHIDDRSVAAENGPEHVADAESGAAAGAGAGAAAAGLGQRDDSDRGDDRTGGQEAYRPGERTTRLKRYVVTERVVQTVEELPDEDSPTR